MTKYKNKVTSIDQPRCIRCGQFKPESELNGCDPLAPAGQKYKSAYCRKLSECDSSHAKSILDDLVTSGSINSNETGKVVVVDEDKQESVSKIFTTVPEDTNH